MALSNAVVAMNGSMVTDARIAIAHGARDPPIVVNCAMVTTAVMTAPMVIGPAAAISVVTALVMVGPAAAMAPVTVAAAMAPVTVAAAMAPVTVAAAMAPVTVAAAMTPRLRDRSKGKANSGGQKDGRQYSQGSPLPRQRGSPSLFCRLPNGNLYEQPLSQSPPKRRLASAQEPWLRTQFPSDKPLP
jgi:hypothetical protein